VKSNQRSHQSVNSESYLSANTTTTREHPRVTRGSIKLRQKNDGFRRGNPRGFGRIKGLEGDIPSDRSDGRYL
jgi:hypothetical protein